MVITIAMLILLGILWWAIEHTQMLGERDADVSNREYLEHYDDRKEL